MASSESFDARAMDDELIVESLDGRAYLTLRARVAGAWRRLHRPAWLTRRRVGLAALSLALLVALALSVTGLAGQWWQQARLAVLWHFAPTYTRATIHAGAPGKLATAWERIPLPPTGDRMDALWGAFVPVPAERVVAVSDGGTVDIGGRTLDVLYTPGHASHQLKDHWRLQ